jgi:hypothetical protein
VEPELERTERRTALGRGAFALGLASVVLLAASVKWAHHWSPRTGTLVVAWALATLAALATSVWTLARRRASKWLAAYGLMLALVSVAALALAGIAFAAGRGDLAGPCGGG